MNLITTTQSIHQLSPPELAPCVTQLFQSIDQDGDIPPTLIIMESTGDPRSPDFQFVGPDGLLSDLFNEHLPDEEGYSHCFEWVHHDAEHQCYITLHLAHDSLGTYLIIPESVTQAHPDLLLALNSQPLLVTLPF